MQLFKKRETLQQALQNRIGTLGFVPTMGALHDGHLSLIRQAKAENDRVVVSIFVNPTQFDQASDLANYPRYLEKDIQLLEELAPDLIIFAPTTMEIYGPQVQSKSYDFKGLDRLMEGASRIGHFQGVATVVEKLFEIVGPQKAYFGEKDFQQLQIIQQMATIQALPITIVGCPIVREADGLAMSSRNQRLSAQARAEAPLLFQALTEAKTIFAEHGSHDAIRHVELLFCQYPNSSLDYFAVCDEKTLLPFDPKKHQKARGFIAAKWDDIRLIDTLGF